MGSFTIKNIIFNKIELTSLKSPSILPISCKTIDLHFDITDISGFLEEMSLWKSLNPNFWLYSLSSYGISSFSPNPFVKVYPLLSNSTWIGMSFL
jgi:hypothetical protein